MVDLSFIGSFVLNLENFLGNKHTILALASIAFFIKFHLIAKIFSHKFNYKKTHISLYLLIIYISTSMISDSAWMFKLIREILLPSIDLRIQLFWIRIAWAFNVIQVHSLSLFIESLIKNKKLIGLRQKIFIPTTLTISATFFIVAISQFNNITPPPQSLLLKIIFNTQGFYNLYALLIISTIIALFNFRKAKIPKILTKQQRTFLLFIMVPNIFSKFINSYPFNIFHNHMNNKFALVGVSLIMTIATIYFAIKKVIGLKFLNMQKNDKSKNSFSFIQDFGNILEQFSQATNHKEIEQITQDFFKSAFCTPSQKIKLKIRKLNNKENKIKNAYIESIVETFNSIYDQYSCIGQRLRKSKVFIKDNIEFINYYEENIAIKKIITFLDSIDAAIFIPMYEKDRLIAYIIVETHTRKTNCDKKYEFYSDEEKNQMIVFASYLGNMINLIENRNLKTLIKKEKELQEELYSKHQEINQYKESIRSLLHKGTEISEIMKTRIHFLKDPTKWDYLLYLETTKSGKLINRLIPGDNETLLNLKIEILQTALSKKAILLNIQQQDLIPIVEMLNRISLKDKLNIINLEKPTTNLDVAIKLFGINPIFQTSKPEKTLLEKLDNTGTLLIKNIHFLDLKTQNKLTEFIKYGIYTPLRGEQIITSSARIIFSTNIDLKTEVQEGRFSQNLLNELSKTKLVIPSLANILEENSKNHNTCKKKWLYSNQTPSDPKIIEAKRLGKHALKNKEIMTILWNRFKNQNKIATLLGVNRSSVNRRFKNYKIK